MDFDTLVDNLKQGQNFSWSRWGDGEFSCIHQNSFQNCDRHQYFPDLGEELKRILESKPKYFLGLQRIAKEQYTYSELIKMNEWIDNEMLHRASINGYISLFFESLKYRRVILVGNRHLVNLKKFNFEHVEIPLINCWLSYEYIKERIKPSLDCVILYSAGMMSKVLIDNFYSDLITQIDTGSVLDPYVGRLIRSYHYNLNL